MFGCFWISLLDYGIIRRCNEKLFYCMCIQKNAYRYSYGRQENKYRFGYGRKWITEKMKETVIKLSI